MALDMQVIHYENELKQRDEAIAQQTERIKQLEAENEQLETEKDQLKGENEQLRKLLAGKAESKSAKTPRFTGNYSLDKNKRKKKRRKKSTGRRSNDAKRIKSFCVAEPTQRLSWTEPRVTAFGVLSSVIAPV